MTDRPTSRHPLPARFTRQARETRDSKRRDVVGLQRVSEETIYEHIFDNADREVGGVLVGRTPADAGLPLVTGAIAAISADEQRATLTFTQDAWEHVHNTLDTSFPPDEQIVGWYHSHPGFGIFLSGHDLFIHENFFSGPSQIAMVVDPLAQTEGVFVWRDEKIVPLFERSTPQDWLAKDAGRGLAPFGQKPGVATEPEQLPSRFPALAVVLAVVIGIAAGVVLGLGVFS